MLPTDWFKPFTPVLARLSDSRVRQFWDDNHLLGKQMVADAREPQPHPDCCEQAGALWDVAAVYPRGTTWTSRLPPAVFLNGPIVDFEAALQDKLTAVLNQ
jgi:hypothetical protein